MIDQEGFRLNVGIIVTNGKGQLLWARRLGSRDAWQFPQGGVLEGETPLEAMYRELGEELGMQKTDIKILSESKYWIRYRLPKKFQRRDDNQRCIGQKQKWFLLELVSGDQAVKLDTAELPEFDTWKWVDYWFPLKQVIFFKRNVYSKVLREFSSFVLPNADV